MNLRDLKRTGGHVAPVTPIGTWRYYGPGELARCPAPACGRGFMQGGRTSQVLVRLAPEGIGSDDYPSGFEVCQNSRCKARREVRILRKEAESA